MKRTSSIALLACLPLAVAPALSGGCKDNTCADLAEICKRCPDADIREACERDVAADVKSICSDREAVYEQQCPFVIDASSSTSVTVGPGSGGMGGVPTGGMGGMPSAGGMGGTAGAGAGGAGGAGGS